jgi:DNA (cytosine-5)-methyltransferase 3A
MKVLSLFDGMSCGMIALDRLGIKVDKYYASEIDKYAIQVSQANYPNIIQIGDVCDIKAEDYQDIDLILAGSPCQGFSFAGKQLAFDDPRSALFFEFIRLLKEIKPKYFLLENVNMKKEFLDVISEQVSSCYPELPFGIERIKINSALVSAQNRVRWYWTNIPGVDQPEQRGIVLRDILEYQLEDNTNVIPNKSQTIKSQYYKSSKANFERSGTFHATGIPQKSKEQYIETHNIPKHIGTAEDINGHDILKRVYSEDGKSPTVNTCGGGNREPKVVVQSYREVRTEEAKRLRRESKKNTGKDHTPFRAKKIVPREDGKVGTVTPGLNNDHMISLTRDKDQDVYWRKLSPRECERLQTVPDDYTNSVSNTQRYKMLGNGWTIEVITHILKNMEL